MSKCGSTLPRGTRAQGAFTSAVTRPCRMRTARSKDYMVAEGLDANGPSWEQYISDPVTTPGDKLQTDVYMPVKAGAAVASGGAAN